MAESPGELKKPSMMTTHLTPALSPRRGRNGFRVRAKSRRLICSGSGVQCAKFSFGEISPHCPFRATRRGRNAPSVLPNRGRGRERGRTGTLWVDSVGRFTFPRQKQKCCHEKRGEDGAERCEITIQWQGSTRKHRHFCDEEIAVAGHGGLGHHGAIPRNRLRDAGAGEAEDGYAIVYTINRSPKSPSPNEPT